MSATVASRRILVIDDSTLVLAAATIALGSIGGHEVLTAADAEQGLARAAAELPDAIVLDVVMPGMDGVAAAEQLARTPATAAIPVVLMTARDDAADRDRYARTSVRGVVGKPFTVTGLAGELAAILGVVLVSVVDGPLRAVWEAHRELIDERVAIVERALAALAEDDLDEARRGEARRAAHMLAGSVGTFGFTSAGRAAAALDRALEHPSAADAPHLMGLSTTLREDLDDAHG